MHQYYLFILKTYLAILQLISEKDMNHFQLESESFEKFNNHLLQNINEDSLLAHHSQSCSQQLSIPPILNSSNNSKFTSQPYCSSKNIEHQQSPTAQRDPTNKNSKQTSPNLLKNLVTTLKLWVNIPKTTGTQMTSALWEYFKNNRKINQRLLKVVFGVQNEVFPEKWIQQEQQLQKIFITETELLIAQQHLRQETIKQLHQSDLEYIVKNRRVVDKGQFKKYLFGFVQQIEGGGLTKNCRIKKQKKI